MVLTKFLLVGFLATATPEGKMVYEFESAGMFPDKESCEEVKKRFESKLGEIRDSKEPSGRGVYVKGFVIECRSTEFKVPSEYLPKK